jgi:CelD/BcsL family acetyltransferase involved in cellulose biosynthesis
VYQSFDACLHMWETVAQAAGRKLFCLVGWQRERAVAIWPLTTLRQYAWRCLRPLEASGAEYTDMLLDPGIDATKWVYAALDGIRRDSRCDVMILPYVKAGTVLRQALGAFSTRTLIDYEAGVEVALQREPDWQTYYSSLSSTIRRKYRNIRRKLDKLGEVRLEAVPAGDRRCPELIDWMLREKRTWAERSHKSGPWIHSPQYRDFLVRLLSDAEAVPKSYIFTLHAGETLLAVKIQSAGKSLCEALVAAFNADYEKQSPGLILDEYCVQWAFERRLNCDFGNGLERNKLFWSRRESIETATYTVALSWWGGAYLRAREWSRKRKQKQQAATPDVVDGGDENEVTAAG